MLLYRSDGGNSILFRNEISKTEGGKITVNDNDNANENGDDDKSGDDDDNNDDEDNSNAGSVVVICDS